MGLRVQDRFKRLSRKKSLFIKIVLITVLINARISRPFLKAFLEIVK